MALNYFPAAFYHCCLMKVSFGKVMLANRLGPWLFTPSKLRRRTLTCAVNQDAEQSFKYTVEVDKLIDKLRVASSNQLQQLVAENILAFNESFWIRLAARTDTCKSDDDKKDYEELASHLMSMVDRLVHKTNEKIESATDVLREIIRPVIVDDEEISWPPRDPQSLVLMEKELAQREQEGQLDEGFLSEVNAQLRQAKEDGDKPGLEAMLQKVLQLYAAKVLSKRSYAYRGGQIQKTEAFLEAVIKAPEQDWNKLLLDGLQVGKGDIPSEDFYAVVKKRIERTLIRTEGGSYQQRILIEYLNGIQSRAEDIIKVLEGKQT
ncbi:uncharacterized protein LOC116265636 isoform X2 [Nymphaea colorata]|uniref:uncharacterized protein LOC116265636 isoform X2 n=2 Tax=Nymphaea colorata TaxID=210225 RepID=UPI00129E50C1|nr:uncharacterized protein LOC116265636 isoform X2 [Nymphaea colorata]